MAKYRNDLPQLSGELFFTDGGIETTLIFHEGLELPYFAAFDLLNNDQGRATLHKYFSTYVSIAKEHGVGSSSRVRPGTSAQTGAPALIKATLADSD